jgi:hypothetical protein
MCQPAVVRCRGEAVVNTRDRDVNTTSPVCARLARSGCAHGRPARPDLPPAKGVFTRSGVACARAHGVTVAGRVWSLVTA